MESHIESHIYTTPKIESYIYTASKITICLLLQFITILFCLTLTLSLTQNKNYSFSRQITLNEISSSKYDNLLSVDNYKNVSINNYQIYKEVDRIEGKNHNLYIEEYNYYVANNNLYSEIYNIDNVEFKEALAYKAKDVLF
ncbi:unnamed protein product [marine sediment metagenome]|uniref:Uncharacterized protein n=1 Tax=marine sediment metagenome TaxID=412755 RepID=X1ASE4_9ZZZZ